MFAPARKKSSTRASGSVGCQASSGGEMETTWRETTLGEIVIDHRMPMRPRLVTGSMLGLFAAFFLYYLVTGLIEYIRVATLAEWVSAIPGLLVVLALFLLFGVPTWIVLVGRSRVVVDLRQGYILKVDDLLFYQRTRTFPIDQVHDVRVKSKTLRISRHSSQTYEIQLHLTGHKPITIGCEDIVWDAHEVARRLRDLLRIGASETPA
jgi:hypothetical protein